MPTSQGSRIANPKPKPPRRGSMLPIATKIPISILSPLKSWNNFVFSSEILLAASIVAIPYLYRYSANFFVIIKILECSFKKEYWSKSISFTSSGSSLFRYSEWISLIYFSLY